MPGEATETVPATEQELPQPQAETAVLPMSSALNAALRQPGPPPPSALGPQQSPLGIAPQPSPLPSSVSSTPFEVPFAQPVTAETALPSGTIPPTPTFLPHLIGPPISPAALALASPMIGLAQKGARSSSAPLSLVALAPHSIQKSSVCPPHPLTSLPSAAGVESGTLTSMTASVPPLELKAASTSHVPSQGTPNLKGTTPRPPDVGSAFPSHLESHLAAVTTCPQTLAIISSSLTQKEPVSSPAQSTVTPSMPPAPSTSLGCRLPLLHHTSLDSPIQPPGQSGLGVNKIISVEHSSIAASYPPERSLVSTLPSRHELAADSIPAPSVDKGSSAVTSEVCSPPGSSHAAGASLSSVASLIPKGSDAALQPLLTQVPASQNTGLKEAPAIHPALGNPGLISVAPATHVSPLASSGLVSSKDPAFPVSSLVVPAAHKQFPAPPVSVALEVPVSPLPATDSLKKLPVSLAQAVLPTRKDATLQPVAPTALAESPSSQSVPSLEVLSEETITKKPTGGPAPGVRPAIAGVATTVSLHADSPPATIRADACVSQPLKSSVAAPAMAPFLSETCDSKGLAPRTARDTPPATSSLVPLASEGCPVAPSMALSPQNASVSVTTLALFPEIPKSVLFPNPPSAGLSFCSAKEVDVVSPMEPLGSSHEGHSDASVSSKGTVVCPADSSSLDTSVSAQTKRPASKKKGSALPDVSPGNASSPLCPLEASFLPEASLSFQGPKGSLNKLSPIPPSSKGAPIPSAVAPPSPKGAPIFPTETSASSKQIPAEILPSPQKTPEVPASRLTSAVQAPKVDPIVSALTPTSSKKTSATAVPKDPKATLSLKSVPAVTSLTPPKVLAASSPTEASIAPTEVPTSLKNAPATATPKETLATSTPKVASTAPAVTSSPQKTPKSISPQGAPALASKKASKEVSTSQFPKEDPLLPHVAPASPPKSPASDSLSGALTSPSPKGAPATLVETPACPKKSPKTATPQKTPATPSSKRTPKTAVSKEIPSKGVTAVPLEISLPLKETSKSATPGENSASSPKESPKTADPKETPPEGVTPVPLEISLPPKETPQNATLSENSAASSQKKSPKTAGPKETPPEGVRAEPLEIPHFPKKAPKTAVPKQVPVTPSPKDAFTTLAESSLSPKKASKTAVPKEALATPSVGVTAVSEISPSPQKTSKTAAPKENSTTTSPKRSPQTATYKENLTSSPNRSPKTAASKETPSTCSEGAIAVSLETPPSTPTPASKRVPVTLSPKDAPNALAESPASPKKAPKTAAPKETSTPSPKKITKMAGPKEAPATPPSKKTPKTIVPKETSAPSEGVTAVPLEIPPSPRKAPKTAAPKETVAPSPEGVTSAPVQVPSSSRKGSKTAGSKETPTTPSPEGVTAAPQEIPPSRKKAPKTVDTKQVPLAPSPKVAPTTLAESAPSSKKASKTAAPPSERVTTAPPEKPATPQKASITAASKVPGPAETQEVTVSPREIPVTPAASPVKNPSSHKKTPKTVDLKEAPATLPPPPTKSPKIPSSKKAPRASAPKEFPASPSSKADTASLAQMAPPCLQKGPSTTVPKENLAAPVVIPVSNKSPAAPTPTNASTALAAASLSPTPPVKISPSKKTPAAAAPQTASKETTTTHSCKKAPATETLGETSTAPSLKGAPKETSETSMSKGVLTPTVNSSPPKKAPSSKRASTLPAPSLPSLKEASVLSPIATSAKDSHTSPVSVACSTGTTAKKDPTALTEVLAAPTPESALVITAPVQKGPRAKSNSASPPKCLDPFPKKDTKGLPSVVAPAPQRVFFEKDSSKTAEALPVCPAKDSDCLHSPKGPVESQVATPLAAFTSDKVLPEAVSTSVTPRPAPAASLTLAPSPVPPLPPKQPLLQSVPESVLESPSKLPAPADEDELPPLIPPEAVCGGEPFQPILVNMPTPKPAGTPAPAPSAKQPVLKNHKGICLGLLCAWCVAHTPLGGYPPILTRTRRFVQYVCLSLGIVHKMVTLNIEALGI
ncbi:nascent polypeptide-associated complex subunit alpha isoform X1 [Mastomys coucha]|uniref:nascent polypeptide-associated complex subunit alpha isoform X1 n=1 Tax=Mastomys coucha TaxID=35658 RepID=UPI00126247CD|nr:nascent polypeptide-associated complex subunit alpha isoform X1 [Mastomys coucha]XP_031205168.1 nascent polypeptide-associated complex subunit alpha isoform X1 [Mastomys coucha]